MATTTTERPVLVGNRLVLVGSVLYLLEWVAIIAAHVDAPLGADVSASDVTSAYSGSTDAWGWAAGWFSVVLLGRVLIMTGLRSALVDSGRPQRIMDFAVVAMAASVILEVATYAGTAGGAWYLDNGGSSDVVRGLDAAMFLLNNMIFGPLGVAVLCAGAAMWISGLFSRVLCGIGLLAGVAATLLGVAFAAPGASSAAEALGFALLLFWIWMLWAGVLCWRATPSRAVSPTSEPEVRPASGGA
jgi:hypothetical protein